MKTSKTNSSAAVKLAQDYNIDIKNVTGTGQNGRVLKSDVQALIDAKKEPEGPAEPAEETQQEKPVSEAKLDNTEVSISVEEPALPVGDRVVLAMIERRTGLPIRQHIKLYGSEPYFLTDSVVPVVAVRVRKQQKKKGGGNEAFNPVLPQDIFEELFGGSKGEVTAQSEEFIHRIGIYSFDGAAQDRLRFSRGLDDEFGRNELERAIRHLMMAALANPNMPPGVFNLRCDVEGASVVTENESDMPKAIERMFSKPKSINTALGMPSVTTLAMERFTKNDQHFGQAFFKLGNDCLTRSAPLNGDFQDYRVYGIFTMSDHQLAVTKGGKAKEQYDKVVEKLNAQGAVIPVSNFRDMILGKFLSGIQRFTPNTMHSIREFLRNADALHARGANESELEFESSRASEALYEVSGQHILNVLEPKFLADACRLVGRRLGGTIDPKSFVQLAVRTSEGGAIVQDKRFTLAHARDVVAGKHPMQSKLSKAVKMVCDYARSWHMGAIQDCAAALSGMKAYYCSRTRDRKSVMVFMLPLHLSDMNEEVRKMEVRPSFFLIKGAPVQVLNKSFGTRIPANLDGFFSKR